MVRLRATPVGEPAHFLWFLIIPLYHVKYKHYHRRYDRKVDEWIEQVTDGITAHTCDPNLTTLWIDGEWTSGDLVFEPTISGPTVAYRLHNRYVQNFHNWGILTPRQRWISNRKFANWAERFSHIYGVVWANQFWTYRTGDCLDRFGIQPVRMILTASFGRLLSCATYIRGSVGTDDVVQFIILSTDRKHRTGSEHCRIGFINYIRRKMVYDIRRVTFEPDSGIN